MRLSLIGDMVLDLQISKKIFETAPKISTGEATIAMQHMRANRELAKAGQTSLNFGHLILVSFFFFFFFFFFFSSHFDCLLFSVLHTSLPLQAKPGVDKFTKVYATAVEAIVGAVYVDRGFEAAAAFSEKWLLPYLLGQLVHQQDEKATSRDFNAVKEEV